MAANRRLRDQRWVLESAIAHDGIEFDQPRLGYYLGIVRDDLAMADRAVLARSVRTLGAFVPRVVARARHREDLALQASAAGHDVTAGTHLFAAACLWELAQWPIWETTDELRDIDAHKRSAYEAWAATADHPVLDIDIPLGSASLPATLHLPNSSRLADDRGRPPLVVSVPGMDAGRTISVARVGDPFLERGVAVLAVDGPGQHEAAIRGIHTNPQSWAAAGPAVVDAMRSRTDVDADRMVLTGVSFGSFAASWVAAHCAETFRGVAVAMPCFEPGLHTMWDTAAPTYLARHMWMAGIDDEDEFRSMASGYDLSRVVDRMTLPWFVIGGTADEVSDAAWVPRLAAAAPGPTTVVRVLGARHALTGVDEAVAPAWTSMLADWAVDRLTDVPMTSSEVEIGGTTTQLTEKSADHD